VRHTRLRHRIFSAAITASTRRDATATPLGSIDKRGRHGDVMSSIASAAKAGDNAPTILGREV